MTKFNQQFYTKSGIEYISKNKSLYQLRNFKIKTLVKIHLFESNESNLKQRKNHLLAFLKEFGNLKVNSISTELLYCWLIKYQRENDYSEKNMSHIKCQYNHFFRWLLKMKVLDFNPLSKIKFKQNATPKRDRVILSPSELFTILSSLKAYDSHLHNYFYTLIHTGARMSEVLNLKWTDIDFHTNRLTFRETKNGEDRSIDMPIGLLNLLQDIESKNNKDHVFLNQKNLPFTKQQIHRALRRFKKAYPLNNKDWRCHDLRHSYAYNFLKKGGEMYQLKAILGHKSIKLTIDLYGSLKSYDIKDPSPYDF